MDQILQWLPIITGLIGTFSAVATITPNRADNAIADTLLRIINIFGMNFGKAKNKID